MGGMMRDRWESTAERFPRLTLDQVRRYAKAEAERTGVTRAIVCNPNGEIYSHDTLAGFKGGSYGPGCYLVETVDP